MARRQAEDKLLGEWFWTDRWTGSSGFLLPMEARGLYREMLTQAWLRGARTRTYPRLPTDEEAIRRACGSTEKEWGRCWSKVRGYWRVDEAGWLVNDTQLEVYAVCVAEFERASNRGKKGAQARAQARAQVATQAPTQAPTQDSPQAPHGHLLKEYPPDPDPDREGSTEQEPSRPRARASGGFTGKRLRVSARQHDVVTAELGAAAAGVDWPAFYADLDARLCDSGEQFDTLLFIKRAAHSHLSQAPLDGALSATTHELLDECQRLHGGACGGSMQHRTRMLLDGEKRKAVVA